MKRQNWIVLFLMMFVCMFAYGDEPKGTMVDDLHFNDYVYTTPQADAEFISSVKWENDYPSGTKIGTLTVDGKTTQVKIPNQGSDVSWSGNYSEGTTIGTLTIDGSGHAVIVPDAGSDVSWSADEFEHSMKIGTLTIDNQQTNVYVPDVVTNLHILITNAETQYGYPLLDVPRNVDDLIQNQKELIGILKEYSGVSVSPNPVSFGRRRDVESGAENFLQSESRDPSYTANVFTNEYFIGHEETNNVIAFYPFYTVGTKIINFGYTYPQGNLTMFGIAEEWDGTVVTSEKPKNNSYAEGIYLPFDGFTRTGASSTPEFDPLAGCSNYTIMAWVLRTGNPNASASRIMADLAGTTDGNGTQCRFTGAGNLSFWVNPSGNSDNVNSTGKTISPTDGTWHHVAISFDAAKDGGATNKATVRFFIDGTNYLASNYSYKKKVIVAPNSASFTVGCASGADSYNQQLFGLMDDLIIFREWNPGTTELADGRNEDVAFWMDMDDAILGKPDLAGLSIDFGQFNPRDPIYSSEQVNTLLGITDREAKEILGEDPTDFGQFDPREPIYSSQEVDNLKEKYWHE